MQGGTPSDDFFTLGRRVTRYLQRQGANPSALASVLQTIAFGRQETDYNLMYEEFLGNLDLPWECNSDLLDDVLPLHREVLTWFEAELWQEYVDIVEAQSGFETDLVMSPARARMSGGQRLPEVENVGSGSDAASATPPGGWAFKEPKTS